MYSESIENGECCVALACDRKSCLERISVRAADHEAAQRELYRFGWRIHRGQQVCPLHVSKLNLAPERRIMEERRERMARANNVVYDGATEALAIPGVTCLEVVEILERCAREIRRATVMFPEKR